MKTKTLGRVDRPFRCTLKPSHLAFAHHRLPALASPGRTGMVLSLASDHTAVTTDGHGRGGAKQLYGVGRSSLPRRPTVTVGGDAPETSPFRRTRLVKTMARPPEGDRLAPGTRGGIETPVEPWPRDSGVGVVSLRLGRRAASVC